MFNNINTKKLHLDIDVKVITGKSGITTLVAKVTNNALYANKGANISRIVCTPLDLTDSELTYNDDDSGAIIFTGLHFNAKVKSFSFAEANEYLITEYAEIVTKFVNSELERFKNRNEKSDNDDDESLNETIVF